MTSDAQTEARAIARCVRGCATDDQYIELVERIATALAAKDAELEAERAALRLAADRADRTERALAERAVGVKGEWHRADGDKSILLYTLRQDGWRKGDAVMVNDVTVRIEAANGSESPIEPIASAILSALTTEPAAPEGFCYRDENGQVQYQQLAPEGRQEAVAWRYRWRDGGDWKLSFHFDDGLDPAKYEQEPLFTRHAEQAVTEAMELARAVLAQSITAGHNVPGPTLEDIEKAFWALDAALKAAMEAGRQALASKGGER